MGEAKRRGLFWERRMQRINKDCEEAERQLAILNSEKLEEEHKRELAARLIKMHRDNPIRKSNLNYVAS